MVATRTASRAWSPQPDHPIGPTATPSQDAPPPHLLQKRRSRHRQHRAAGVPEAVTRHRPLQDVMHPTAAAGAHHQQVIHPIRHRHQYASRPSSDHPPVHLKTLRRPTERLLERRPQPATRRLDPRLQQRWWHAPWTRGRPTTGREPGQHRVQAAVALPRVANRSTRGLQTAHAAADPDDHPPTTRRPPGTPTSRSSVSDRPRAVAAPAPAARRSSAQRPADRAGQPSVRLPRSGERASHGG